MRVTPASFDERGAVIVLVAVLIVVLLGMVALVVDVGGVLLLKGRLETAADSASLAAAQSCANGETSAAQDEADAVAFDNLSGVTGAKRESFDGPECGAASGTVSASYGGRQGLYFAPVLGFDEVAGVTGSASAMWGPATGAEPMPIVLSEQCMQDDACGYWFDPENDSGAENTFGFVDLARWCDASGFPRSTCGAGGRSVPTWITGTPKIPVRLDPIPDDVRSVERPDQWEGWDQAVGDQNDGQPRVFAIHEDPVPTRDYTVVGFQPLMVSNVFLGTAPARTQCINPLAPLIPLILDVELGDTVNVVAEVALCVLLTGLDTIEIVIEGAQEGVDYVLEPNDPDVNPVSIRWIGEAVENLVIWFFGVSEGFGGECGLPVDDDHQLWCLVVSWNGPKVGGTEPNPSAPDLGLRAIRLTGDE